MFTRRAVLALATVALSSGCAFSNIDLVQDHRLKIVSPAQDDTTVSLPVTLAWTAKGLDPATTSYAVFFDNAKVIKPGAPIASFAKDDKSCLPAKGCPDVAYLRDHGVVVTSNPTVTIPTLIDERLTNTRITRDEHTATVVILTDGHRDGESAFATTFIVARTKKP